MKKTDMWKERKQDVLRRKSEQGQGEGIRQASSLGSTQTSQASVLYARRCSRMWHPGGPPVLAADIPGSKRAGSV